MLTSAPKPATPTTTALPPRFTDRNAWRIMSGNSDHLEAQVHAQPESAGADLVRQLPFDAGIQGLGGAEAPRPPELVIGHVHSNDASCPGDGRALDDVQTHAAAAEHRHRLAGRTLAVSIAAPTPVITAQPMRQARDSGMSSSIFTAAEACTTVRSAKAPTPLKRAIFLAILGEANVAALLCQTDAGVAQVGRAGAAIGAVAAVPHPRQDHMVTFAQVVHRAADLLDDARAFVAQHHGRRIGQVAAQHRQVRVADAGGGEAHHDLVVRRLDELDGLDGERDVGRYA